MKSKHTYIRKVPVFSTLLVRYNFIIESQSSCNDSANVDLFTEYCA